MTATPNPLGAPRQEIDPATLVSLGFNSWVKNNVQYVVPPLATVPSGTFTMGSDPNKDPNAYPNEYLHQVTLAAYQIGVYHLTVAEYALAVTANVVPAPPLTFNNLTWQRQLQRAYHPVMNVSWLNLLTYTQWLTQLTGQSWRMPREAEWEKAARGTDGRIFPWGNQFDPSKANTVEDGPYDTTPIGAYTTKGDASPYGCHDIAGNGLQWTSSIYFNKPYQQDSKRENINDRVSDRVFRGGSWRDTLAYARAAYRAYNTPSTVNSVFGGRLVCAPPLSL